MLHTKYSISYYILPLIIICGIFLRLFFVFTQPLWLDEQFSIFFSQRYSATELLYTFNHDIHPGGYYFLLKVASQVTQSITLLRLLTAFVPELIAFGLLLKTMQAILRKIEIPNVIDTYNNHSNAYSVLAFLYFLNPLVIDQSWQLRMYGMVLLLSSASIFAVVQFFLYSQKKDIIALVLLLLIGISFTYSFIGLALILFLIVIYLLDKPKLIKTIFGGIFCVGVISWFLILSGFNSRSQLEYASWISQPSIETAPSVYLTIFGLNSNIHGSIRTTDLIILILEYSALILILLFIYQLISKVHLKEASMKKIILLLISTVVLFTVAILSLSIALPFLSNRIFFHHFTPNISLFLPRTHIVILPAFWILFCILTYNLRYFLLFKSRKLVLGFILISVTIVYLSTLVQIHDNRLSIYEQHHEILEQVGEYTLILPDWIEYLKINQSHILDKEYFVTSSNRVKESKEIEVTALNSINSSGNKTKKTELDLCNYPISESLIIFTQSYSADEISKLKSNIKACCQNELIIQSSKLACL